MSDHPNDNDNDGLDRAFDPQNMRRHFQQQFEIQSALAHLTGEESDVFFRVTRRESRDMPEDWDGKTHIAIDYTGDLDDSNDPDALFSFRISGACVAEYSDNRKPSGAYQFVVLERCMGNERRNEFLGMATCKECCIELLSYIRHKLRGVNAAPAFGNLLIVDDPSSPFVAPWAISYEEASIFADDMEALWSEAGTISTCRDGKHHSDWMGLVCYLCGQFFVRAHPAPSSD